MRVWNRNPDDLIEYASGLEAENTKLREALERLDDELSEPLWLDVALPRLRKMIANALGTETVRSTIPPLNPDKG